MEGRRERRERREKGEMVCEGESEVEGIACKSEKYLTYTNNEEHYY